MNQLHIVKQYSAKQLFVVFEEPRLNIVEFFIPCAEFYSILLYNKTMSLKIHVILRKHSNPTGQPTLILSFFLKSYVRQIKTTWWVENPNPLGQKRGLTG